MDPLRQNSQRANQGKAMIMAALRYPRTREAMTPERKSKINSTRVVLTQGMNEGLCLSSIGCIQGVNLRTTIFFFTFIKSSFLTLT